MIKKQLSLALRVIAIVGGAVPMSLAIALLLQPNLSLDAKISLLIVGMLFMGLGLLVVAASNDKGD